MSVFLDDQTLALNAVTTVSLGNYPANNVGWVVLLNASPFALHALVGQFAVNVPAWYFYPIKIGGKLASGISVTPYQQTIPGASSTKTLSTILYDLFEQPNNLQPTPLGGGPIDLTTATNINQTGQPGGNSVVFAEPVGDSSTIGTVNINNLGQMTLGDATHNGSLLIEGLPANGQISFSLTGFVRLIDINANIRVDVEPGIFTLRNAAGVQVIAINSDANPAIDLSAIAVANALQFPAGTLTRIKFGVQGGVTNAGTTITHGLGVTPDVVFTQIDNFALSETSMADTVGSTTFRLSTSTANTRTVWWLALKA